MKIKENQSIPVRMHSCEYDKARIISDTGEIPGGCIADFKKGSRNVRPVGRLLRMN